MTENHPNSRRDFLKGASAATLAALSLGAPRQWMPSASAADPSAGHGATEAAPRATADSMILLWMGGAIGQTETFDPKRYTEYEPGIETKRLLCTFPQIDTAADHIKFCEGVEKMASVMDRGALIRSFVARDYGGLAEDLQHIPFQYKWHTGYSTPSTVPAPFLGAWISKVLGPRNPDLPAYIEIGRSEKTANVFLSLGAFSTSGFFGAEHGSLMVPDPSRAAEVVGARLKSERFDRRYAKYRELVEASPAGELAASYQKESMVKAMDNAYRLVRSPAVKSFDLGDEPADVVAKYDTGPFGRGCLLARRLIERQARFVEVHVDFENAKGWDTHSDGHNGQAVMKKIVDGPIAQLVLDLEQRGLLERTLVVVATEFGRSALGRGSTRAAKIENISQYGLHGHFASAGVCLLYGGGIKPGTVYGKTNDEFPCEAVENPVRIHDLHATIYKCMGISPKLAYDVEKRPFYATKDGIGKPIGEILA